jgi:hypothetical protein
MPAVTESCPDLRGEACNQQYIEKRAMLSTSQNGWLWPALENALLSG